MKSIHVSDAEFLVLESQRVWNTVTSIWHIEAVYIFVCIVSIYMSSSMLRVGLETGRECPGKITALIMGLALCIGAALTTLYYTYPAFGVAIAKINIWILAGLYLLHGIRMFFVSIVSRRHRKPAQTPQSARRARPAPYVYGSESRQTAH